MVYSWGICITGILGVTVAFDKYFLLVCNFIAGFGVVPCNSLNLIMLNE